MTELTRTNWIVEFTGKRFLASVTNFYISPHLREYHVLIWVETGSLTVSPADQQVTIGAGQSLLIPSGLLVSFSSGQGECRVKFHYIQPELLLLANDGKLPNLNLLAESMERSQQMAELILTDLESSMDQSSYTRALATLSNDQNCSSYSMLLDHELMLNIQKAKDYVADNFKEKLSLDQVSEICGMDRWRLTKRFKQVFGLTLFQYLHACRVSEAKKLLAMGHAIPEVAFECMFADQSHLNRLFRKYVGITPKTWIAFTTSVHN